MTDEASAKRAEWHQWAEREFGANHAAVEAATEAVVDALVRGNSVPDAMAAARAAATSGASRAEVERPEHLTSDPSHLRGVVGSFRERSELMGTQYGSVWNFRVDHWDKNQKLEQPVSVEMRGISFAGSVGDGDWVEIAGDWKPGDILHTTSLRNISQNSTVVAHGGRGSSNPRGILGQTATGCFLMIFAVIFVGALVVIGTSILNRP
jgi:hypothetical protein